MKKNLKGLYFVLAALAIWGVWATMPPAAVGQSYPTKPIQLIVSWPPGGVSPILSTLIAEESKKYLPKPVVVNYKTGAAGTIGASFVAKSPPDGYTMLLARAGHISCAPYVQKVDYDPLDFVTTGQLTREPGTLAVKADAPWKNLRELVDYARKNPVAVTCGISGTYGPTHLLMLRFEQVVGAKFNYVPFKGSGDAMTGLAGGHVMSVCRWPGEGEPLITAGKVRDLTVFAPTRASFYPQVPTAAEEGFPLEGEGYTTVMGPKGTPPEVIKVWEDFIRKLAEDKSFVKKAEELHLIIDYQDATHFKEYLARQIEATKALVKRLDLKPR